MRFKSASPRDEMDGVTTFVINLTGPLFWRDFQRTGHAGSSPAFGQSLEAIGQLPH
jgi:hypothetical protein